MTVDLNGLIPAIVLPMRENGDPDERQLRRYVRWVSEQGPIALAVNVDTGEGPHLTHQEKMRVLEVVKEETHLPCVAGVAGPFTAQAVRQAHDFKSVGADALLMFPIPAYLSSPLNPEIPLRYHQAVAEVGLPLILFQLQPALGGVNFDADTLRQLIGIDGVVALKEASFDARRYLDTVRMVQSLPKYHSGEFIMLTGNDNFILESFMLGCAGALIGFGAIMTREQARMIDAWRSGKINEARELGARVQRLADVVFAAPVAHYRARLKEGLVMLGVLDHAHVRPPLLSISDQEKQRLRETLVEVGLLMDGELA
ncbi:MAG: dihydrodipicolinate synthase family protein [Pseudonocardia sp.]|nr:dihydrodipicolinate synthase family protein [Pseudonocardia sp.]